MKLEFSWKIFEKSSNTKFHKNLSSGSRVVPYGRMVGQTWRSQVAFRNFAVTPKIRMMSRTGFDSGKWSTVTKNDTQSSVPVTRRRTSWPGQQPSACSKHVGGGESADRSLAGTSLSMYAERNNEERSCNHCCRGRAISITYSQCVFEALRYSALKAHAPCFIVICALLHLYSIFPQLINNTTDGEKLLNKKCVLNFSTTSTWNISHSAKK
jgi:hypothetical protein